MTAAELIEELQQYEPSMRVVTWSGYGYSDVDKVTEKRIALNVYDNGDADRHAAVDDREDYPRHVHADAVAII